MVRYAPAHLNRQERVQLWLPPLITESPGTQVCQLWVVDPRPTGRCRIICASQLESVCMSVLVARVGSGGFPQKRHTSNPLPRQLHTCGSADSISDEQDYRCLIRVMAQLTHEAWSHDRWHACWSAVLHAQGEV